MDLRLPSGPGKALHACEAGERPKQYTPCIGKAESTTFIPTQQGHMHAGGD